MGSPASKDRWTILFLVIILIMAVEIVYLIKQNRDLRAMVEHQSGNVETLTEHETVPPFSAVDINDNTISIAYAPDAPYTMLFWLSPDCSVCAENVAFWNRLNGEYTSEKIKFVGLCDTDKESALSYSSEHKLSFPVVSPVSSEIVESYQGDVLPQTILISPQGAILNVWPGSLSQSREEQVLAVLRQLNL